MTVAERTREAEKATTDLAALEDQFRAYAVGGKGPAPGLNTIRKLITKTLDQLQSLRDQHIVLELSDELRAEILGYMMDAQTSLIHASAAETEKTRMGQLQEAIIKLEALRHVLRDGVETEPLRSGSIAGKPVLTRADAVRQLEDWFPRLEKSHLATLLGVSTRTVDRWRELSDAAAPWQAEMGVQLAGVLRHSWTGEGVVRWFGRARPELGGRTPSQVLTESDSDLEQQLLRAAQSGRAPVAT